MITVDGTDGPGHRNVLLVAYRRLLENLEENNAFVVIGRHVLRNPIEHTRQQCWRKLRLFEKRRVIDAFQMAGCRLQAIDFSKHRIGTTLFEEPRYSLAGKHAAPDHSSQSVRQEQPAFGVVLTLRAAAIVRALDLAA